MGLYDLVINCSGLGSKELVNDGNMYPTRGHLIRVSNHCCLCYVSLPFITSSGFKLRSLILNTFENPISLPE